MTDRDELIFLRDHINAHLGAVQPPVETQPPSGGTPPPTSGSGAPGPVWTVGEAFDWNRQGQVMDVDCDAGTTYAMPYTVPEGWAGELHHEVLDSSPSIGTVNIRIWESLESGGPAIAGTVYEGLWIGGTMPAPTFHPTPGSYFFNLLVKDRTGHVRAQQHRYP